METLTKTIFTNWNFMRWFRLAMGIIIAYQAYELQNGLMGLFAGLFIFQALANTGCCGAAGCSIEPSRKKSNKTMDVEFEEIKSK